MEQYNEKSIWLTKSFIFSCEVYLQVLLTRLTQVDQTQLILKPSIFDKNRLVALHLLRSQMKVLLYVRNT
jgi:hypothetical protein